MTIWALSDPHLPFGNPSKTMEVFGSVWKDYPDRIEKNWKACVGPNDLVIVAGDLSWATKRQEALFDLNFLDALPGEKLIIRGNHDYWWPSVAQLKEMLPKSLHFIHNNAFEWEGVAFGGTRLWDTCEYDFAPFIEFVEQPFKKPVPDPKETERIFMRELDRLTLSLKQINRSAEMRIALTHYPPIGAELKPSRASTILEDFGIDICVFGHLHNVRPGTLPFGEARGVRYVLTSADYLGFTPIKILD